MAKGGVRIPILSEFKPEGIDKAIKEFQKLESTSKKIGFGLQKAFVPAGIAIGGLVAAAIPAVKAAADLQEAQSKVNVVFGDSAKSIQNFADTAATSMGQSKQSVFDAAGVFGTFGKSAGLAGQDLATFTTDFITLASDLASFNNTTPEQAIEAIGAALRGESEPLRTYGVLLDDATLKAQAMEMGIYDGVGALTQQEKVLAAQKAIFEQTGDAQGDFTRTSESLTNQMKIAEAEISNLSAELGEALLPFATKLVGVFRDMVGLVSSNKEVFTVLAVAVGATAGAVVAANIAMKTYAGLQTVVKIANAVLGTSFQLTATQTAKFVGGLAGVGIAIGAAVFIYQDYMRAKNKVKDLTAELVPLLQSEAGGFDAVAQKQLGAILAAGDNQKAIELLGISSAEYFAFVKGEAVPQLDFLREAAEKGVRGVLDLNSSFGKDTSKVRNFGVELNNMRKGLENAAAEAERLEIVTKETTGAIDVAKESTKQFDDTSRAMADSMAAAEAAMAAYEDQTRQANDALQQMIDTTLAMFDADLNLEAQIARTEEAIWDYATALADGTLKGRELEAAQRDVKTEALRQAAAAVQAAEAQAELAGATLDASDRQKIMVESLAAVADALNPADPLRKELVEYIQQLGLIPSVKETVIRTIRQDIVQTSIIEANQFSPAAIAAASQGAPRQSRNIGGPVFGLTNRSTPIMAHGGEYVLSADVVSAIKRGAPSRGLGRGGAAGGGGGNVINITVTSADPQAVVEAIRRYNRTNGPAPIKVAS